MSELSNYLRAAAAAGITREVAVAALAVELSAQTGALAATPAPLGKPGGPGLWGRRGWKLPNYIEQVRNGIMKSGVAESKATAIAIGRVRAWAAGRGQVSPEVRAAATAAIAEFEKLRAQTHLSGDADAVELAAVNKHHVPGTAYHWRHNYHPLDVATALLWHKKKVAEALHKSGAGHFNPEPKRYVQAHPHDKATIPVSAKGKTHHLGELHPVAPGKRDAMGNQVAALHQAVAKAKAPTLGPVNGPDLPPAPATAAEKIAHFAAIPDVDVNEPALPTLPDGKTLSSGLIVREPDGRLWIIKPKGGFGGYDHTFSKGGVEDGLTPQQNAHKELEEETGLQAKVTGYLGDYAGSTTVTRMYLAERTGGAPLPDDATPYHGADGTGEVAAVKLVTPEQAKGLFNTTRDKKILADAVAHPQGPGTPAEKLRVNLGPVQGPAMPEGVSGPKDPFHPVDTSHWTKLGGQKGSNQGGTYADDDGVKYYLKHSASDDHARNEVLATALYGAAGIDHAQLGLATHNGKLGTASELIPGATPNMKTKLGDVAFREKLQSGFAVDAWLGNWDVAGQNYDNVVSDSFGNPVRVDPGGALLYRAQGTPKGAAFGNTVTEWDSLRNPATNPQAASAFGGMSDAQLKASAQKVADITPAQIDDLVGRAGFDPATTTKLAGTLKARRLDIMALAGVHEKSSAPAWTPSPQQVQSQANYQAELQAARAKAKASGTAFKAHLAPAHAKAQAAGEKADHDLAVARAAKHGGAPMPMKQNKAGQNVVSAPVDAYKVGDTLLVHSPQGGTHHAMVMSQGNPFWKDGQSHQYHYVNKVSPPAAPHAVDSDVSPQVSQTPLQKAMQHSGKTYTASLAKAKAQKLTDLGAPHYAKDTGQTTVGGFKKYTVTPGVAPTPGIGQASAGNVQITDPTHAESPLDAAITRAHQKVSGGTAEAYVYADGTISVGAFKSSHLGQKYAVVWPDGDVTGSLAHGGGSAPATVPTAVTIPGKRTKNGKLVVQAPAGSHQVGDTLTVKSPAGNLHQVKVESLGAQFPKNGETHQYHYVKSVPGAATTPGSSSPSAPSSSAVASFPTIYGAFDDAKAKAAATGKPHYVGSGGPNVDSFLVADNALAASQDGQSGGGSIVKQITPDGSVSMWEDADTFAAAASPAVAVGQELAVSDLPTKQKEMVNGAYVLAQSNNTPVVIQPDGVFGQLDGSDAQPGHVKVAPDGTITAGPGFVKVADTPSAPSVSTPAAPQLKPPVKAAKGLGPTNKALMNADDITGGSSSLIKAAALQKAIKTGQAHYVTHFSSGYSTTTVAPTGVKHYKFTPDGIVHTSYGETYSPGPVSKSKNYAKLGLLQVTANGGNGGSAKAKSSSPTLSGPSGPGASPSGSFTGTTLSTDASGIPNKDEKAFAGTQAGEYLAEHKPALPTYQSVADHYKATAPKITSEQREALGAYVGSWAFGSTSVNQSLRQGLNLSSTDKKRIAALDEAANNYATPDTMYVMRGFSPYPPGSFPSDSLVGKVYQDKGFGSSGVGQAFPGAVRMRVLVPKGTHGISTLGTGEYNEQYEFILPRDSQFLIQKDDTVNGTRYLTAVVVPSEKPAEVTDKGVVTDAATKVGPGAYSKAGLDYLLTEGRTQWLTKYGSVPGGTLTPKTPAMAGAG